MQGLLQRPLVCLSILTFISTPGGAGTLGNCSSQPRIPCYYRDIPDERTSYFTEEYFVLDKFAVPHVRHKTDNDTYITWTYQFQDDQLDGFSIDYYDVWRVIILQKSEKHDRTSMDYTVNFTTAFSNNNDDDNDDDEDYYDDGDDNYDDNIRVFPLMIHEKDWDHTTAKTDFYLVHPSATSLKVSVSSDIPTGHASHAQIIKGRCNSGLPTAQSIRTNKTFVIFTNLTVGDYCIKVTPIDPYPNDPNRCICYYGNPRLRQCFQPGCATQHMDYRLRSLTQDARLTTLLGAVGGSMFAVIFILVIIVLRRRQILDFLHRSNHFRKRRVLILTGDDDSIHIQLVECLKQCLAQFCNCHVHCIGTDSSGNETTRSGSIDHIFKNNDAVILIVSPKLLSMFYKNKDIEFPVGRMTLLEEVLTEITKYKSQTKCKICTVYFNEQGSQCPIAKALAAQKYELTDDFQSMLLTIYLSNRRTSTKIERKCSKVMTKLQTVDKFIEMKWLLMDNDRESMFTIGEYTV